MDSPEVLAALILGGTSFLFGILNLILNIISVKSSNKNQREIESIKFKNEKKKIDYLETRNQKTDESKSKKRVLNILQVIKDNGHVLIQSLEKSNKIYWQSLANWQVSLEMGINIYQETYMNFNEGTRKSIHEIKNLLHYSNLLTRDALQEKKSNPKSRIRIGDIEYVLTGIEQTQNELLNLILIEDNTTD